MSAAHDHSPRTYRDHAELRAAAIADVVRQQPAWLPWLAESPHEATYTIGALRRRAAWRISVGLAPPTRSDGSNRMQSE